MKEIYGEIELERHKMFGFNVLSGESSGQADAPYLIGMTRTQALDPSLEGRLIRNLFLYNPPCCAFTPADQKLLQLALTGMSETQLAEQLGISKETVKSRWDSIYSHIPLNLEDELFGERNQIQKSRALLNWLRNHPEEIRPTLFISAKG